MIYSVWNQNARAYDYYESSGAVPISSPSPRHLKSTETLGIPPEKAGWPLPPSARLVGRGQVAKGVIALDTPPDGLGGIGTTPASPLLLAGIAGALYYFFGRRKA
jgi:hypothetical protein